jgi:hypothetical protein
MNYIAKRVASVSHRWIKYAACERTPQISKTSPLNEMHYTSITSVTYTYI